jgi:raffinose/stachyose/melibiose transport system substrate-binding protein
MGTEALSRRTFLAAAGLAGLSVPLLGACGGDDEGSSGKTTVEWWTIATTDPGKTLFPQLAQEYMRANPNVTIKHTPLENDAYKNKMTALIASGKLPDVFHTWGGGVLKQQIDAGLVKDLSKDISSWQGTIKPLALQPYQFDGKTYGVPYDTGLVGFWYNKALFEQAKIESPPATWTEYLDAVRKLKAANITPIALAGKEKWPGHYYWAYLAMRIGGLSVFKQAETGKDWSGPAFVQAGEKLKELVDLQPFQQGFLGADYPSPTGQAATMGNGKAAMELMGQWAPSVQADAGKGLGDDLGFFLFPTVEGGQGKATEAIGGGNGWSLREDAPKAAVDFLKWFSSVDVNKRLVASKGYQPVIKGAEGSVADPNLKVVVQELDKATGFQLYLDQAFPPAVGQQVNDSVAGLLAGQANAKQVTDAITKTAKSN